MKKVLPNLIIFFYLFGLFYMNTSEQIQKYIYMKDYFQYMF